MNISILISLLLAANLIAIANAVYLDGAFQNSKNFYKFDLNWDDLSDFHKEVADKRINVDKLNSGEDRFRLIEILVKHQVYLTSDKKQKEWASSDLSMTEFDAVFRYNFRDCPKVVHGFSDLMQQIDQDPKLLDGVNQTTLDLIDTYKVCKFISEDENLVNDILEVFKQNYTDMPKDIVKKFKKKFNLD